MGAREASPRFAEAYASKQDSIDTSDAQSRLIEARQWEEAEASFARDMEAGRRREEDMSAAREDAEFARDQAERGLEQAVVDLQRSDAERAVGLKLCNRFLQLHQWTAEFQRGCVACPPSLSNCCFEFSVVMTTNFNI